MNVKVYSGTARFELVTGLDPKVFRNDKAVKIIVPPNSTVELAWGQVPFNLEYAYHFSYWRQMPIGITYDLGTAFFTEDGEVHYIAYNHTNLYGDDALLPERFLSLPDNLYGAVSYTHLTLPTKRIV